MKNHMVLALFAALSSTYVAAAGPRAVEGAEPQVDTRVHAIFDADGNVAMRFLYPEPTGPFNFVWNPKTGWHHIDEAKDVLEKFAVVFCKDQLVKEKVPVKCGPFGGMFSGGGSFQGSGFFSEYQSNFVGPPQADFIGPPVPVNNTWQGTIGGPGGPVPGGIPPAYDPLGARQACINTCYVTWTAAVAGCVVLSETVVGAAYCVAAGAGASSCSGSC